MKLLKKFSKVSLQGSTLIEVLIGLTLISFIFLSGSMVWLKLTNLKSPARQFEQRVQARNLIEATLNDPNPSDDSLHFKGYRFLKTVSPLSGKQNLYHIAVECQGPDGVVLLNRHKILKIK